MSNSYRIQLFDKGGALVAVMESDDGLIKLLKFMTKNTKDWDSVHISTLPVEKKVKVTAEKKMAAPVSNTDLTT